MTEEGGAEKEESVGFGMKFTIAGIKRKFPSVKNLTTEALSNLLKSEPGNPSNNLIILDARAEEEYNVGHIPGSRRVNYKDSTDTLMAAVPELQAPDVQATVVCYCSLGYRSSVVAQKIEEFMKQKSSSTSIGEQVKVYNLEGSIFKWANEHRQMLDKNNIETKFAHPFNAMFGKLLNKELRKTSAD